MRSGNGDSEYEETLAPVTGDSESCSNAKKPSDTGRVLDSAQYLSSTSYISESDARSTRSDYRGPYSLNGESIVCAVS